MEFGWTEVIGVVDGTGIVGGTGKWSWFSTRLRDTWKTLTRTHRTKPKKIKSQGSIPGAANRKTSSVVGVVAVRICIVGIQITVPGNARPSNRRTPPVAVGAQIEEPATRVAVATRQARETARIRGARVRRRSEERRVGKECNGQCRSRWSPYH